MLKTIQTCALIDQVIVLKSLHLSLNYRNISFIFTTEKSDNTHKQF